MNLLQKKKNYLQKLSRLSINKIFKDEILKNILYNQVESPCK